MEVPVRVRTPAGRGPRLPLIAAAVVAAIALAAALALSVFIVGLGEVAVVVDPLTGSIGRPVLGPAVGFKAPWAYVVKDYAGVEAVDMFYEPPRDYPAVESLTRDGVVVHVDITIRYKLNPGEFDTLVRNYPRLNYEEDFLVSTAREVVRNVIANFTLTDVIEKRDVVARTIEQELARRIKGDPIIGRCLDLQGVNVRNIKIPDPIVQAINEKVAAQQRAIKAEYERQATLIQANASATAAIIAAQGEAQARVLRAQGEAEALLRIAEAQARGLQLLINATRADPTEVVRYYLYLQALRELAQSGRATIIVSPTGLTPLVSLPTQQQGSP